MQPPAADRQRSDPGSAHAFHLDTVRTDPFRHPGAGGTRVLVVEDDEAVGRQLVRGLDLAGYTTSRVTTGRAALASVRSSAPPEILLLDLGLPDIDGSEVCRRVREIGDIPMIVVTARGDEADRVAALDLGSDDYLVKPFGFAELLARMRAVRRRAGTAATGTALVTSGTTATADGLTSGTAASTTTSTAPAADLASGAAVPAREAPLRNGPLVVDPRSRRITMHGRPVAVTARQFDLLACLAREPGRVLTRREILTSVWGEWFGSPKVLDVHVGALRRKLGEPGLIETVYGVGFRLAELVDTG